MPNELQFSGFFRFKNNPNKRPGERAKKAFYVDESGSEYRFSSEDSKHLRIYILCGQSNGGGYADISSLESEYQDMRIPFYVAWDSKSVQNLSSLPGNNELKNSGWKPTMTAGKTAPNPATKRYNHSNNKFGPELGFAVHMDAETEDNIGIIKYAAGASSSAFWKSSGPGYTNLKNAISSAVANIPARYTSYSIDGVIFWQGESGAAKEDLQDFITSLRSELAGNYNIGADDGARIPFVVTKNTSFLTWGSEYGEVAESDNYVSIIDVGEYGQRKYLIDGVTRQNTHIGSGDFGIKKDIVVEYQNDMFTIGIAFAKKLIETSTGKNSFWNPQTYIDLLDYESNQNQKSLNTDFASSDRIKLLTEHSFSDYGNDFSWIDEPLNGKVIYPQNSIVQAWMHSGPTNLFVRPTSTKESSYKQYVTYGNTQKTHNYTQITERLSMDSYGSEWTFVEAKHEKMFGWIDFSKKENLNVDLSGNIIYAKNPCGPTSASGAGAHHLSTLRHVENVQNGNGCAYFGSSDGNDEDDMYSIYGNLPENFHLRFFIIVNPVTVNNAWDPIFQMTQGSQDSFRWLMLRAGANDKFNGSWFHQKKVSSAYTQTIGSNYFNEGISKKWVLIEFSIDGANKKLSNFHDGVGTEFDVPELDFASASTSFSLMRGLIPKKQLVTWEKWSS